MMIFPRDLGVESRFLRRLPGTDSIHLLIKSLLCIGILEYSSTLMFDNNIKYISALRKHLR